MEYREIITISDKTSLADADKFGKQFANCLRDYALCDDWKVIYQFVWDADFIQQLGPFIELVASSTIMDEVLNNKYLMGWMRHTLPSFVMLKSMFEALLTEEQKSDALFQYKGMVTELVRRSKKAKTEAEANAMRANFIFGLAVNAIKDFAAYVIYNAGDPDTFRKALNYKTVRFIEKESKKTPLRGRFLTTYAALLSYIPIVTSVIVKRLEQIEEAERLVFEEERKRRLAKRISNSRFKTVTEQENKISAYKDSGFKLNPFSSIK